MYRIHRSPPSPPSLAVSHLIMTAVGKSSTGALARTHAPGLLPNMTATPPRVPTTMALVFATEVEGTRDEGDMGIMAVPKGCGPSVM